MEIDEPYDLVVIGGGAAGFMGALTCKEFAPQKKVAIIERHSKFLSKVAISGGGRCNLTHHCFDVSQLIKNYPRGSKELYSVFTHFQPADTVRWFSERGVETKTEADGRMFPITDNSATVVNCLLDQAKNKGIELFDSLKVSEIIPGTLYNIHTNRKVIYSKNILLACGGMNQSNGFKFLDSLNLKLVNPTPSLFSFHIHDPILQSLSGISCVNAWVKVIGKKDIYEGALLITHQGMSGPAILKTSAFEAIELSNRNYIFDISINWVANKEEKLREYILTYKNEHGQQQLKNSRIYDLPKRLLSYLLTKANIDEEMIWAQLPVKKMNQLIEFLINDKFQVNGKSTNKEEFVTAGGIHLKSVDFKTMRIKDHQGLYAAGEILDIDGITGGFNFQSAWSTGYIAGKSVAAQ